MAKPFQLDTETIPTELIKISDINDAVTLPGVAEHNRSSPTLSQVDELFGPLRFGELTVSRQELQALGARLDGQAITAAGTYFSEPDQGFINALEFDPAQVEQRIKSVNAQEGRLIPPLLYEIVTLRSPNASPLMREVPTGESAAAMNKIIETLNASQRLDIRKDPLSGPLPDWVDKAKSRGMTSMGVGLQAYGLYSAYIGAIDAMKKGQTAEVLINVGGGLAEITSLGLEYALNKTGDQMIRQGAMVFEQFGKTTMGKWLCRGSGLIASVLTLPFDIYTAIKSFSEAAEAQGKQAQDLYVTGGLSVFSGVLSLALGCAALMGFQAAGPVGIAAAAIMIIGARVYGAVRMVDDIDDYIELSVNERWRSGWFAFTGQEQDKALMERFTVAKTHADYAKALKTKSVAWLDHELKDSVDTVVNGRFDVKLQPTRLYKYQWSEGESTYTTKNLPVIEETDDTWDASAGLPADDAVISKGINDPAKGVLWNLGGGADTVKGVSDKPNLFSYGAGTKNLSGGIKDDSFLFQSAADGLDTTPEQVSLLQGGEGVDLLWLQGREKPASHGSAAAPYVGYDVNLQDGTLGLRSADPEKAPVLHTRFEAIEKIETLAGASNRVTGSALADTIAANGNDRVEAGAGDDHITVRGRHGIVEGGLGSDTYILDATSLNVSITEDGQDPSKVYLGVALEAIQRWQLRDDAVVIETLRDDDPRSRRRQLVLEAVYRTVDNKRLLQNDQWTFITQDGYHLQPAWPAETPDLSDTPLSVVVVTAGVSRISPVQLNDAPHKISPKPHSFYFVSRKSHHTILVAPKNETQRRSTLYVEYDSSEINEVRAIYDVRVSNTGAFTWLGYRNIHFTLTFLRGGLLSLHDCVFENPGRKTDVGNSLHAPGWTMNHAVTLVMRDGISYHLDFPRTAYLEDARNPGYRLVQSRESLRQRAGQYLFVRPSIDKRTLKTTPQRVDFRNTEHYSNHWLEGRSSTYELYPVRNTSIRLSTATSDASLTGSSTWNIHTAQLQEVITDHQLTIKDDLLKVGSVHVHLPDSSDPGLPLETVNVILASGNRYSINALFETIGLYAVNVAGSASIQSVVALIQEHKSRELLEWDEVHVLNVRLPGAPAARIFYNASTGHWTRHDDASNPIDPEQLTIGETPLTTPSPN